MPLHLFILKKHWIPIDSMVLLLIAMAVIMGCVTISRTQETAPVADNGTLSHQRIEQAMAMQPRKAPPTEGSLWEENSTLGEMFANTKAKRIGDIVTIKIVENSSASNKATTTTGRSSGLSAGLTSFLGAENDYTASSPFFNPFSRISGDIKSDHKGTGATQRSGALTAYMTARIVNVLSNGDFYIQGNREVRVNDENQIISLSGIIRSRDISPDNVIQSTYIADAQIAYSGTGIVNDRQKPGWFTRIMDTVWPF